MPGLRRSARLLVACTTTAALGGVAAQTPRAPSTSFDVAAHYDKREALVPMRDGIRLFTIVYTPKDSSSRFPILLTRTAYGIPPTVRTPFARRSDPVPRLPKEGYIFVYQDIRGKWKSEGEFIHHRPVVQGPGDPTRARTPTTPSRGYWRTCRTTTGASASGASRGRDGRCRWA